MPSSSLAFAAGAADRKDTGDGTKAEQVGSRTRTAAASSSRLGYVFMITGEGEEMRREERQG